MIQIQQGSKQVAGTEREVRRLCRLLRELRAESLTGTSDLAGQ